ncbi:MAG TPA: arginase family protein [Kofleriaceae bacterium]|nr:arginase family protein [Kofleriaceae bacterium]
MIDLIDAPNHLGLRPPRPGVEPGAWKAPAALDRAGLARRLQPERHARLPRRDYVVDAQPGTRIRNGVTLREFSLALAGEVETSLRRGALPVVVGGDCSNVLGCLLGLRRAGGRGLVHVDGHSDFFHPGNYDAAARLGSAAGMDLALATGRGEPILTAWPDIGGPLVADADVVQIGERDAADPAYAYRDIEQTAIERITVQSLQAQGTGWAIERTLGRLGARGVERGWLHIDLDVLDQAVMPAVDSPGTPGLTYAQLSEVIGGLVGSGRIAGLDVAIYDPDLDPDGKYAPDIAAAVATGLASATASATRENR